ncbi:GAF domain-containing protein [Modestobacter lacusdianchii]
MPIDEQALKRSLERLTAGLPKVPSVGTLSSRVALVVSAAREVLSVEAVGLLLLSDTGQLRTVATTGPASAILETAQADLGVGPGVDVLGHGSPVAVADMLAEPAYALLRDRVRDAGLRAVVSAPVSVDRQVVGNLNGMRPLPHEWTPGEITAAEAFAGVIGALLGLTARATPRALLDLMAYSPAGGVGAGPSSPDGHDGERNSGSTRNARDGGGRR